MTMPASMTQQGEQPKRPMLRYLRIAFSAVCGIICLLLIALWVRSYWRVDQLIRRGSTTTYYAFTSSQGQAFVGMSNDPGLKVVFGQDWTKRGFSLEDWYASPGTPFACFPATTPSPLNEIRLVLWPHYRKNPFVSITPGVTHHEVMVPYWLAFLLTIWLALIPWIRWRFSLRTLLIAATLIAVLLGIIASSN